MITEEPVEAAIQSCSEQNVLIKYVQNPWKMMAAIEHAILEYGSWVFIFMPYLSPIKYNLYFFKV